LSTWGEWRSKAAEWLLRAQVDRGYARVQKLLLVGSGVYRALSIVRMRMYREHGYTGRGLFWRKRPTMPVISVGNYTWGGTGKTPFVLWLTRLLQERGLAPVVVVKMYGGGDELRMLKRALVKVDVQESVNFFRTLNSWATKNRNVAVIDDGLQSHSLYRDVNVVMVDALHPLGVNARLIPAGSLRELPSEALARAQMVVIHNVDHVSDRRRQTLRRYLQRRMPRAAKLIETSMKPLDLFQIGSAGDTFSVKTLQKREVVMLCGIGNPDSFALSLQKLSCHVQGKVIRADHHIFTEEEIQDAQKLAKQHKAVLVTTEKDYSRHTDNFLANSRQSPIFVLRTELQLSAESKAAMQTVIDSRIDTSL